MDRSEKDQMITVSQEGMDEMREMIRVMGDVALEVRMLIDCPLLHEMIKMARRDMSPYAVGGATELDVETLLDGITYFMNSLDRQTAAMGIGSIEEVMEAKKALGELK